MGSAAACHAMAWGCPSHAATEPYMNDVTGDGIRLLHCKLVCLQDWMRSHKAGRSTSGATCEAVTSVKPSKSMKTIRKKRMAVYELASSTVSECIRGLMNSVASISDTNAVCRTKFTQVIFILSKAGKQQDEAKPEPEAVQSLLPPDPSRSQAAKTICRQLCKSLPPPPLPFHPPVISFYALTY